jgi:hypothetical protein
MATVIRGALVVVGLLAMLLGLGIIVGLPSLGGLAGLQLVAFGAFLVVIVTIERHRYRSAPAERSNEPAGPGGGEPVGTLEARFKPTSELFVDPVSGQRMRVVIDPTNGERRYIAEG